MTSDKQYSYDLAYVRAQSREYSETKAEVERTIRKPSGLKFALLRGIAGIGDLVDVVGTALAWTGIAYVIAWIIKFIVSAILFFAGLGVNSRVKAMHQLQEGLQQKIAHITRKINTYTRRYMMAVRIARKFRVLRKPVRKMVLKIARARKRVLRNPAVKNTAAIGADFIPLLDMLPWRVIGVELMYRDELATWREANEIAPDFFAAKADEVQAANDLAEAEVAEAGVEARA